MNVLPEVIYNEILSYLSYENHLPFASTNLMLSKLLLKRVRRILIREEEVVAFYFSDQIFRDHIHSLMLDPSNQLKVEIALDPSSMIDSISCKELSTTVEVFVESIMSRLNKLHSLTLQCKWLMPLSFDEMVLEVAQWMNSSPSLKEFSISSYDIIEFPVISNLQSLTFDNCRNLQLNGLNIPAYSNLRVLKFYRCGIDDVSCLDRIHELHFRACQGIHDISCLNHNYKVVIENCESIVDYSNSFRHSKVIKLACFANFNVNFDFSKLLEVREIDLTAKRFTFKTTSFVFPRCKTLRKVVLNGFNVPFIIPAGHQIRTIEIAGCDSFNSLSNFGSISSVSLIHLKITSLEGLGMGNHVVEIRSCPLIRDFTPLRHCGKVIIRDCQGLEDINQVRGVKELTFSPVDVNNIPEDLEGVTHLLLRKIPDDLDSIVIPNTLKRLEFRHWSKSIEQCLSFCSDIPSHVHQIKVVEISPRGLDELLNNMDEPIRLNFTIELWRKGINFLRRVN